LLRSSARFPYTTLFRSLLGNSASLSAWYVLKSTPVERGGSPRAVITVVVSALVVSALWASLGQLWWRALAASGFGLGDPYRPGRSEEHTAELQSREKLV